MLLSAAIRTHKTFSEVAEERLAGMPPAELVLKILSPRSLPLM
jgi:hypothetical protein